MLLLQGTPKMRAGILIAMVLRGPIRGNAGISRPQKHPGRKRLKEAPKKPASLIEVLNEKGQVIYRGRERRSYREQVFFDSANKNRRFMGAGKIGKKRLKEAKKLGEVKVFFGMRTYPSQRSSKRKLKNI